MKCLSLKSGVDSILVSVCKWLLSFSIQVHFYLVLQSSFFSTVYVAHGALGLQGADGLFWNSLQAETI
jgi:hypothetical protein